MFPEIKCYNLPLKTKHIHKVRQCVRYYITNTKKHLNPSMIGNKKKKSKKKIVICDVRALKIKRPKVTTTTKI